MYMLGISCETIRLAVVCAPQMNEAYKQCDNRSRYALHPPTPAGTSNTSKRLTFQTLSGELVVEVTEQGKYAMDFPLNAPAASPLPEGLELNSPCIAALAGSAPVKETLWNERLRYGLLVLGDKNDVLNLTPDLAAAQKAKGTGVFGIVVTSKGGTIPATIRVCYHQVLHS